MNRHRVRLLLTIVFGALSWAACSAAPRNEAGDGDASDQGGVPSVGAGCDRNTTVAYPPGPYGHDANAVIRDVCVRGFPSPGVTMLAPWRHDFYDPSELRKRLLFLSGTGDVVRSMQPANGRVR